MLRPAVSTVLLSGLLSSVACVPEAITPNRAPPEEPEGPPSGVETPPPTPTLTVTALEVEPEKLVLEVDASAPVVAFATYEDGSAEEVTRSAAWQSLDARLLLVERPGSVKALAEGQATLRVSFGGLTADATVDIRARQPEAPRPISLALSSGALSLEPGAQARLTAEATFDDGARQDVTAAATWSSLAPGVATVSGGQVTAAGEGQAQITATWEGLEASATVTVAGCTYPGAASSPIQVGSTMPPLAWETAVAPGGAVTPLRLEELHCARGQGAPSVIIFVVGAGWCSACPSYIRSVYAQAPQIEAAGGLIVFVEAEDASSRAASSAYAHQYISNLVGTQHGVRVGDGDTRPAARTLYNAPLLQAFPSAFVVRTRDMRILADQASSNTMLPYVRMAQDPDGDWSNPSAPPFVARCGPADEEPSEPNDAPAQAALIGAGSFDAGICTPEPDYYRIDLQGSWQLTLEFSHAVGDLDVYVWDEARNQALTVNGRKVGSDSATDDEQFSHAGPALVRVEGYQRASAPYRLTLTAQ